MVCQSFRENRKDYISGAETCLIYSNINELKILKFTKFKVHSGNVIVHKTYQNI